jgi:hypothetical protein
MKNDIALFHNPFIVMNEEQPAIRTLWFASVPHFEYHEGKGNGSLKILPKEIYPQSRDFCLRMSSMFGSMYLCERTFSNMKFNS